MRAMKWRFQFRLRTLLIGITVIAVGLGVCLRMWVVPAQRQRAMVRSVEAIGGRCAYLGRSPLNPSDYFDKVFNVTFTDSLATDDDIDKLFQRHQNDFGQLESFFFIGTPVTDKSLAHLGELKQLKGIGLLETKVTDAGVAELQKALPGCTITRRTKR